MDFLLTSQELTLIFLAFFVSLVVTRVMIGFNIKDTPHMRSSHNNPTPRAGGLGIAAGFFCAILMMGMKALPFYPTLILWVGTFGIAGLMAVMGFLDDVWGLPYQLRLVLQILAALWLLQMGASIPWVSLPLFGTLPLGFVGFILGFLWLTIFPNAFHFLDGLDGLAAGTAASCSAFLTIIAYRAGNPVITFTSLILCASTLGFIVYNFPKPRIFMGNTGGLFIGFLFASYALIGFNAEIGVIPLWTIPLLFFFQLYDIIIVRLRRVFLGRGFFTAHKEHLFQLLNRAGWSHARISLLYWGITFLQGLGALSLSSMKDSHQALIFIPYLLGAVRLQGFIFKKARAEKVAF